MMFNAAKVGRGFLVYLVFVAVLYGTVDLSQKTAIASTLRYYEGWKPTTQAAIAGGKRPLGLPASGTATGSWDRPGGI